VWYYYYRALKDFFLAFVGGLVSKKGYRMGVMGFRAALMFALLRFFVHMGVAQKPFVRRPVS
jgi:hypothetical protein